MLRGFTVARAWQSTMVYKELAPAIAHDDAVHAEARLDGTIPEALATSDRAYPTLHSALERAGQLEVGKALAYIRHALHVLETVSHNGAL